MAPSTGKLTGQIEALGLALVAVALITAVLLRGSAAAQIIRGFGDAFVKLIGGDPTGGGKGWAR